MIRTLDSLNPARLLTDPNLRKWRETASLGRTTIQTTTDGPDSSRHWTFCRQKRLCRNDLVKACRSLTLMVGSRLERRERYRDPLLLSGRSIDCPWMLWHSQKRTRAPLTPKSPLLRSLLPLPCAPKGKPAVSGISAVTHFGHHLQRNSPHRKLVLRDPRFGQDLLRGLSHNAFDFELGTLIRQSAHYDG